MKGSIHIASSAALFYGVKLPFGLEIDEIEVTASPTVIDIKGKSAVIDEAKFEARVSPNNLIEFIRLELPSQISQSTIEFIPGKIILRATVKFIIEMAIEAEIGLEIRDNKYLDAKLISVDKPGPVAGIISANLAKQNPLFDIEDLPFVATLDNWTIDAEFLRIMGSGEKVLID